MTELRASDDDRERAAQTLRTAAGQGRITVEELDERLHQAYRTVTRAELEALVADVADAGPDTRVPIHAEGRAEEQIVSVLGGADRSGHWRVAPRTRVVNVLGGADLDLTQAELGAGVVEMTVISVLGGADLYLPDTLNVEVSETNLLGGNDLDLGETRPDPGGPVLRLRLVSVLGGSNVRRGPKLRMRDRLERRQERRLERRERRARRRLGR